MGTPNSALRELVFDLLARNEVTPSDVEAAGLDVQMLELICKKIKHNLRYARGFKQLGQWYPKSEFAHPEWMLGQVAQLQGEGVTGGLFISREGHWAVVTQEGRSTVGSVTYVSYRDDELRKLIAGLRKWNPIIASTVWPHAGSWVCPAIQIAYRLEEMLDISAKSFASDAAKMRNSHGDVGEILGVFRR